MKLAAGLRPPLLIILLLLGQMTVFADGLTSQLRPLNEVLDQISETYEVIITYNSRVLSNIEVSFELRAEEQLETAVNRALAETNLRYRQLTEKYYIVFKKGRTDQKRSGKSNASLSK